MNRGEIRQELIAALNEESSPVYWTADELNRYIDDAYVITCRSTLCLLEEIDKYIPNGERFIDLPARCIAALSVHRQEPFQVAPGLFRMQPVDPCHWSVMEKIDRHFFTRVSNIPDLFASFGLKRILLNSSPTTDDVAGTRFRVLMAVIPHTGGSSASFTPLTDDTRVPNFPPEFHYGLVEYAWGRALLKNADGQRLGRAKRHFNAWQDTSGQIWDWNLKKHHRLFKAVFGEPKRVVNLGIAGYSIDPGTEAISAENF